jgi:hypothetical protein
MRRWVLRAVADLFHGHHDSYSVSSTNAEIFRQSSDLRYDSLLMMLRFHLCRSEEYLPILLSHVSNHQLPSYPHRSLRPGISRARTIFTRGARRILDRLHSVFVVRTAPLSDR